MAHARQCDICGKLYAEYNTKKDSTKPNGFIFISVDHNDECWYYGRTDLCPECLAAIQNLIDSRKKAGDSDG